MRCVCTANSLSVVPLFVSCVDGRRGARRDARMLLCFSTVEIWVRARIITIIINIIMICAAGRVFFCEFLLYNERLYRGIQTRLELTVAHYHWHLTGLDRCANNMSHVLACIWNGFRDEVSNGYVGCIGLHDQ